VVEYVRRTRGGTLSDAPKGDSRNTSLMEVVGGASVSAKACRCLHKLRNQRWSTRMKGRDRRRRALEQGVCPKVGCATARKGEVHFCFGLHGGYLVGVLSVLGCVYIVLLGGLRELGEAEKGGWVE
jgi:hypothetical protein